MSRKREKNVTCEGDRDKEKDRKKDKKREKETLKDRQTKYVQERWLVSSHAFHSILLKKNAINY